jgi:lipopolysaccharide export system protein LptA
MKTRLLSHALFRLLSPSLLLLLLLAASPAFAEKADKEKPVNLESDRITVDDVKKVHIFEGNVVLQRGTLVIRTERLVVTQDAEGFQKGVAYGGAGGLARFRQKREARDEYVEGEAERIEHDGKIEKTEFFQRAFVKSGTDEVRGQYIAYDGRNENYVVTNGPQGTTTNSAATGRQDRVRAVIQPKGKDAGTPSAATVGAVPLTPAQELANPR